MWRATLLSLGFLVLAADTSETARLNALLEDRRSLNMQYTRDAMTWAREDGGDYMTQRVDHEKGFGAAYEDLLRYAVEHDDVTLKRIVLRVEYHDELRGYYESLGYAETDEERALLRAELEQYEADLATVDPAYRRPAVETEVARPTGRRGGAAPY